MWAAIDKNNIVVCPIVGVSFEEAQKIASDNGCNALIEMTLENSPASIGSYWDGTRFVRGE